MTRCGREGGRRRGRGGGITIPNKLMTDRSIPILPHTHKHTAFLKAFTSTIFRQSALLFVAFLSIAGK